MSEKQASVKHVRAVLENFESEAIQYCVLRNFEFLAGGQVDGDVDVLVRETDQEAVTRTLQRHGFQPADGDTTAQTAYLRFVSETRQLLVFDIYWDEPTYNGLPLLDGRRTLANRRRYEGVYIPSEEDYFVELVFHPALNKNRYRNHYRAELKRLQGAVDEFAVREHARTVFGSTGVSAVEAALAGNYDKILKLKWEIIRAGLGRQPTYAPTLGWNLFGRREIYHPVEKLGRQLSPRYRKPVIALLGPDGAGKTSVAQDLERVLEKNGFDPVCRELGVYNGETPIMRWAKWADSQLHSGDSGDDPDDESEETDRTLPRRGPPLRTAVHLADIGVRQLGAEFADGSIIISDRYVHDVVLYNRPGVLDHLLALFEREPFYPVVLGGDPEKIATRSEYDTESVARMLESIRRFNFPEVDTTQNLDNVVTDVLETVFRDSRLLQASGFRLKR